MVEEEQCSEKHSLMKLSVAIHQRARQCRDGFPPLIWHIVGSAGLSTLKGNGLFEDLPFIAGAKVAIECETKIPARVAGVSLEGQPLEALVNSLYPISLECDGRLIFQDSARVPVASGPALLEVLPVIDSTRSVKLRHTISFPNNQISEWHQVRFMTPNLRARFSALDTFAAQLELASYFSEDPEDLLACDRAATLLAKILERDGDPLDVRDEVLAILAPLTTRIAAHSVHLIGHSHIDLNWLWTWSDTVEVIKRDIRSVLALMDDFPELTFSHSQAATYELIEKEEPTLFEKIRHHVQNGRWEPLCMTWVEHDHNLVSGESHARQLLYGMRYAERAFGKRPTVYHAPDTFGHPGNLPQLVSSAGAKIFYHHRCNPGGDWPAYWWEGIDGTRILCICTPSYNGEITAGEIAIAIIRAHRHGHKCGLHFHGIGDHGGGPSRHNLKTLRELQRASLFPKIFCSTLKAYSDELLSGEGKFPVYRGEPNTIFEGCYTTQSDTKYFNRKGENLLLTAETVAALADLDVRECMDRAWKQVLFHQFHDIVAGSAIHEVYEDQKLKFQEIQNCAHAVIEDATKRLSYEPEAHILVVNSLSTPLKDWVTATGSAPSKWVESGGVSTPTQNLENGHFGFVAHVAGLECAGYRPARESDRLSLLTVKPAFSPFDSREDNMLGPAAVEPPYLRVETEYFVAYLRCDCGIIVGLFDKRTSRELVSFGMRRQSDYLDTARPDLGLGVLQLIREYPHRMSSWQMQEVFSEYSLLRGATSRVVETGPVRAVIETRHVLEHSSIIQRTILYAELPFIDFETHVDWDEPGDLKSGITNLKVAFCARLEECQAWRETPFAASQRPCDGQEVPALGWADVGGESYGMSLINEAKYGYDILGSRVRISLLRTAYEPDPIADRGHHEFRYRLAPHPGSWRTAEICCLAAGFNRPMIVSRAGLGKATATSKPSIRPSTEGRGVRLSSLKAAEYGTGIIFRLHEFEGSEHEITLKGIPEGWNVSETDLVERAKTPLPRRAQGDFLLHFSPWKVRTFRAGPA